jgi:Rrf2 family transcriptional regulator, iron-sulfur cluster assembly transcription factor
MELTREADYAVLCMLEVAKSGRMSAAEVARRTAVPPAFLGKIVGSLARAGMVKTRRGVHGGVELSRAPDLITLLDVIEGVQGPLRINECLFDPPRCEQVATCAVFPVWRHAQEQLHRALEVTLAEILAAESNSAPRRAVVGIGSRLDSVGPTQLPPAVCVLGTAGGPAGPEDDGQ